MIWCAYSYHNKYYVPTFVVQEDEPPPDVFGGLTPPEDGVNIHGLFIDAGRWDMTLNKLVDALPGLKYDILHHYLDDPFTMIYQSPFPRNIMRH